MADRSEELRRRLLATFRVEADEHIAAVSAELDAIANRPTAPDVATRLQTLFRVVHTLKGAARSVGSADVEQLAHRTEALLRELTQGRRPFDLNILGVLQQAGDGLASLVAGTLPKHRVEEILTAIEERRSTPQANVSAAPEPLEREAPAGEAPPAKAAAAPAPAPAPAPEAPVPEIPVAEAPVAAAAVPEAPRPPLRKAPIVLVPTEPAPEPPPEPAPAAAPPVPPPAGGESIRIEVGRLDRLLLIAEELLIPKLAAGERARSARSLVASISELRGRVRAGHRFNGGGANGHNGSAISEFDEALRGIESEARRLATALAGDYNALRATADDLFDETRRARLKAAGSIFEAFPRMIRDIARETGKEVAWQLSGEEIEVDRRILDAIKDPLIHLVRNAVDHGIEPPAVREAAGKPRQGQVSITVQALDGGRVAIEVADNGKGFDLTALAQAAVRSRVLKANQADTLDEAGVAELAFHAGVSTSPVITNISGNGLGLAIVRERIERFDGQVSVRSQPGIGTVIRMELPVTIATSRGLIVRVGGLTYAWPSDSLETVIGLPQSEVKAQLSKGLIAHEGETLPLGHLASVLGHGLANRPDEDRRLMPCLIVRAGPRRSALLVDEVLGDSEIRVKELRPPLRRVRNIAMAGLLGTGELILMLRPSDVLASIHAPGATNGRDQHAAAPRTRRLLVVDDSITTRTMERNLFESAGYAVRVAADGVDAWTMLQIEEVDLVVSDIDMPRMNGFDLTGRIRSDPRLAELPVVLVTALEAREDKERGVQVGANAYVLKSAFDQSNLLEIVGRLV